MCIVHVAASFDYGRAKHDRAMKSSVGVGAIIGLHSSKILGYESGPKMPYLREAKTTHPELKNCEVVTHITNCLFRRVLSAPVSTATPSTSNRFQPPHHLPAAGISHHTVSKALLLTATPSASHRYQLPDRQPATVVNRHTVRQPPVSTATV